MREVSVAMTVYINKKFLKCAFVIDEVCTEWNNTIVIKLRRKQRKYKIVMSEGNPQIYPVDGWIFATQDCTNSRAIHQHMNIFKATAFELTSFYDDDTYRRELLLQTGIYIYNKQDINDLRIWTINALV
jgi:hypothetical protein